jgi:branched-subunit amino acid aminotransferase/4-amino-4-deoxychorismate lyase
VKPRPWHFARGAWRAGVGVVALDDRSFRFGDGCFETMLVEGGSVRFAKAHVQRLTKTLKGLRIPHQDALLSIHRALSSVPNIERGALRLHVSAGVGGGLRREHPTPMVYAMLTPYSAPKRDALIVKSFIRRDVAFAGAKLPHYLEAVLALSEAPVDDVLSCTSSGDVLESSAGNVFALIDDTLVTPPLDGSILPGVTRHAVLSLSRRRLRCIERTVSLKELGSAKSVFLTSSLRGIASVSVLNGRVLSGDPAFVTWLRHAYEARQRKS